MSEISVDQLLVQCASVDEAQWVRGEMISWNPRDYWFYVYQDGRIMVANEFAGFLNATKLKLASTKADELVKQFRKKTKS